MEHRLNDKLIGVMVADGVDTGKLTNVVDTLRNAGATVHIISPSESDPRSWNANGWGDVVSVDQHLRDIDADRYDGLVVPGGQIHADALRSNHAAVALVRRTIETGRPLAIIGHAAWLLVETDLIGGMSVTGAPSIKTDLRAAGADWMDEDYVVDFGVVTVQSSEVLDQALPKIVEEFAEGRHERPGITDVVAEASAESFPASDPPSWQPGAASRDE